MSLHPPDPFHRCWAEINFAALQHNVATIRDLIPAGSAIAAVVKANAYGHGLGRIAEDLQYVVELLAVANVVEALEVKRHAPDTRVLILGPALPEERATIVENRFSGVVSSVEEARAYAALVNGGQNVQLHLAVDTGMGRIGVLETEAVAMAKAIAALPGVELVGIGTHLPSADDDDEFTRDQLDRWRGVVRALRAEGVDVPLLHCLNSAGTILYGHAEGAIEIGDAVRTGLMLYGSSPVPEFQHRLRPVMEWKTRITLVREVPMGIPVSYGRTFVTPRPMRIATLAAGYADGYRRSLSNNGAEVLIGGRRCAVLGRVTMDQLLIDVTEVDGVKAGDEAVLMGRQGKEEILASELAAKAGTIAWEIFTGISSRVVRQYLN